jgi:hypothetical protein
VMTKARTNLAVVYTKNDLLDKVGRRSIVGHEFGLRCLAIGSSSIPMSLFVLRRCLVYYVCLCVMSRCVVYRGRVI